MNLTAGKVAVVTGAASGIGLALAERFAASGMNVVLADVDGAALRVAIQGLSARGVETLAMETDVSDEGAVLALAQATVERFGTVHVVCNNAGVGSLSDPWFGPISAWKWVLGVNLWGIVHGVRAFLPILLGQEEGHIVNTASVAGLIPGLPIYSASKHAVVSLTEDLYTMLGSIGSQVGVSVLCPSWVRTQILDSERNWPASLGEVPPESSAARVIVGHLRRVVAEATPPAVIADQVADAIESKRYWILPDQAALEAAMERWTSIAERRDPELFKDMIGLPPAKELAAEIAAALGAHLD